MAKRLIYAEALWHKLETEPWYNNADRDEVALPLVDDAPTVDAVEVVRCAQCKYFGKEVVGYYDDEYYCTNPAGLDDIVKPDDFCSYGERKEG